MPNIIESIATYNTDGYSDLDRAAALALRLPLLAQLYGIPAADRMGWLLSLIHGIADGSQNASLDRDVDAYQLGQRMSLLLTEEGHA
jgi:hypothetical protein